MVWAMTPPASRVPPARPRHRARSPCCRRWTSVQSYHPAPPHYRRKPQWLTRVGRWWKAVPSSQSSTVPPPDLPKAAKEGQRGHRLLQQHCRLRRRCPVLSQHDQSRCLHLHSRKSWTRRQIPRLASTPSSGRRRSADVRPASTPLQRRQQKPVGAEQAAQTAAASALPHPAPAAGRKRHRRRTTWQPKLDLPPSAWRCPPSTRRASKPPLPAAHPDSASALGGRSGQIPFASAAMSQPVRRVALCCFRRASSAAGCSDGATISPAA
mmetsp:Transcript_24148/g.61748  ORF Transcript_24148/g.61748 Transcript_24148/m.61748 type:complete len:267 (+) Transcript_24148:1871-2671(+)